MGQNSKLKTQIQNVTKPKNKNQNLKCGKTQKLKMRPNSNIKM